MIVPARLWVNGRIWWILGLLIFWILVAGVVSWRQIAMDMDYRRTVITNQERNNNTQQQILEHFRQRGTDGSP